MAYTNSPLATVKFLSPNHSGQRNHEIDTITIHCVVGQCTAKSLGELFLQKSRQASSNYGIGYDGEIGLYVEEKNRSWCSSSASNDHRAITIEVASDTTEPYAVTDKAYAALIDLVTDICQRNNIKELKWKADKSLVGQVDKQNMTVHRWFANKSCPGTYLYNRHAEIATEVNKRLNNTTQDGEVIYRVQTGAFRVKANAEEQIADLKKAGFDGFIVEDKGKTAVAERPKPAKRSIEEVAQEIVYGNPNPWGNGTDRTQNLTAAGYTAEEREAIQDRVNQLLK